MVNYFQTPRVQMPVVSCEDACLHWRWGQPFAQIPHAAANDCYIRIPAQITPSFPADAERRQDLFISTCFWNTEGTPPEDSHYVDLCDTCLTVAGTGENNACVAVALIGKRENGKTRWAQSKVRLLGSVEGGCDFVDPRVLFDQNEFRINIGNFLNFLGLIFDEAGDTSGYARMPQKLEASLLKRIIDRKK